MIHYLAFSPPTFSLLYEAVEKNDLRSLLASHDPQIHCQDIEIHPDEFDLICDFLVSDYGIRISDSVPKSHPLHSYQVAIDSCRNSGSPFHIPLIMDNFGRDSFLLNINRVLEHNPDLENAALEKIYSFHCNLEHSVADLLTLLVNQISNYSFHSDIDLHVVIHY